MTFCKYIFNTVTALILFVSCNNTQEIFIEAESFENKGGWVIDNQSMYQMGSSYLLAHGMGIPVENAKPHSL